MVEIGGEPRMVLPFLKVFLFADIIWRHFWAPTMPSSAIRSTTPRSSTASAFAKRNVSGVRAKGWGQG
jgi:hypothetical protein